MDTEETQDAQVTEAEADPLDKVYEGMQDKPVAEVPAEAPAKPEPTPDDKSGNDKPAGTEGLDEQTLKDIREGKLIPKYRFDELSERVKAFESFGTPEQLREMMAKVQELEKLPREEKNEAVDELSEDEKEIRKAMLKMFPFLKDIPKTQEELNRLKGDYEQRTQREIERAKAREDMLFKSGENKIKELCEKNGLDCSDEQILKTHIGSVTEFLNRDRELSDRFYNGGDVDALQTAFDKYFKAVFSGFQRKAKAEILNDKDNRVRLPKAPAKGGTPPSEPKKKQSSSEAMDMMAEAFISAAKE